MRYKNNALTKKITIFDVTKDSLFSQSKPILLAYSPITWILAGNAKSSFYENLVFVPHLGAWVLRERRSRIAADVLRILANS